MSELKPCPFCGSDARLFGGLEAQENYSVWCREGHHLEGGYDRDVMVKQWNQRSQVDVISSDYTPGLSPLAKRKIEQMGGEVMGVVVRNEAGALAAVTDMGRVTWLDDAVAGPVDHVRDATKKVAACRFHGDDHEACVTYSGQTPCESARGAEPFYWLVENVVTGAHTLYRRKADADAHRCMAVEISQTDRAKRVTPLYTQPQSAGVPEALRSALTAAIGVAHDRKGDVSDEDGSYATTPVDNMIELETALCELFDTGSDDVIAHEMLPKMEALLTTTPQPAGDDATSPGSEWVRCSERLPTEMDGSVVWSHDEIRETVELVSWAWVQGLAKNGKITHWMPTGLKRPQPPREQGGE